MHSSAQCDLTTPSFVVDLSQNADSVWLETNTSRLDSCCFQEQDDPCIMFVVSLAPSVGALYFSVENPQPSISASQFHINCDTVAFSVQDTVCVDGYTAPYTITYCKPGNDRPDYIIAGIGAGEISPPIVVSDACVDTISAIGFVESSLVWNSTFPGAYGDYNYFLSDSLAQDTVIVTPTGTYPDSVQYEVCGDLAGFSCSSGTITKCDSTWVYFVSSFNVTINPQNPTICFGGTPTTLTTSVAGGAPPYTYLWSTGETTPSINVSSGNAGVYWVQVRDTLECAGVTDTVVVTEFLNPITANAGVDDSICSTNLSYNLNGSVTGVSTGVWSGGGGTYAPSADSLITTYTPSAGEITAGFFVLQLATTNNGSCPPDSDSVMVTIITEPLADAGLDQTGCFGSVGVQLNGAVTNATGGIWTTSGTGTFAPDSATLNAVYFPSTTDLATGNVDLVLTTEAPATCTPNTDTVAITFQPGPTALAGNDTSVCITNPNVQLNGSITLVPGAQWNSGGTGSFSPNDTVLNATYIPSVADLTAGSVIIQLTSDSFGNCVAIDSMVITYTPDLITVNAGLDTSVCNNTTGVALNGSVLVATGGTWSTTGTGTFSPNANALNAIYVPSAADTLLGSITLTLTTTGNGGCTVKTDQMIISFLSTALANAGSDTSICFDVDTFFLNGNVINAPGGVWTTSGSGTFVPNDSALNAGYVSSLSDVSGGSVQLVLTTQGAGTCAYPDTMTLSFLAGVNAGQDTVLCPGDDSLQLNGLITGVGGGSASWSTSGTGTFVPNQDSLNAIYVLSTADSIAGGVTLFLSTSGPIAGCAAGIDSIQVSIDPPPVVSVTPVNITICASDTIVALAGTITNAAGVIWSTSGGGYFSPSSDSLNTSYIVNTADIVAGNVTLTMASVGSCLNVSQDVSITILPAPTATAGNDTSVCRTNPNVTLNGIITLAPGGTWTTSGTGSFSPNDTVLSPTYIPSAADTAAGSVYIILTSDSFGTCVVVDSMMITYTPDLITVNAGNDTSVCKNTPSIPLEGLVSVASGGVWSTSGTGSFLPSADSLITSYVPTPADTILGVVTITLTTTGNGGCIAKTDQMIINFLPSSVANAGIDTIICFEVDTIGLNGSITFAPGGVWTSTGSGMFLPNDSALNAQYVFSSADQQNGSLSLILTSYGTGYCEHKDTINISIRPPVFAGLDTVLCEGSDTLFLFGTVIGAGALWSSSGTGSFTPSDTLLNTAYIISTADSIAGAFTIYLNATGPSFGCPAGMDSIQVTLGPPATVVVSPQTSTVCSNDSSIALSATIINASGGSWVSSGDGVFNPSADSVITNYIFGTGDVDSGTVTLTLTTNLSCMNAQDFSIITIIPGPNADFFPTDVCVGDPTTFIDSSSAPQDSIISWNWDLGDGTTTAIQHPGHVYAIDSTYNVSLIVQSQSGCVDTVIKQVTAHPSPTAAFSFSANCQVDSALFTDNSTLQTGILDSWNWSFGDGNIDTTQNPANFYDTSGTFLVELIVTSLFGCDDTLSQNLVIHPSPNAAFIYSDSLCAGLNYQFIDSSFILSGSISNWNWDFGNGFSSTTQNQAVSYNTPGSYSVELIVTSDQSCTDTANASLIVFPSPTAAFTYSGHCANRLISFSDSSILLGDSLVSWQWYFGDGNMATSQNASNTFSVAGNYGVSLVVHSQHGCSDTITNVAVIDPSPVAEFSSNSPIILYETMYFSDESIGADTWQWDFGDTNGTSVAGSPSYLYQNPAVYTVTQTVSNLYDCYDTIEHEVIVAMPPDIPNAFSPNGDGKNDILYALGGPYKEMEFTIYNNWGERIFISNNRNFGWDGTKQGIPQPVGVYVYKLNAITEDDVRHLQTGDVTLLR